MIYKSYEEYKNVSFLPNILDVVLQNLQIEMKCNYCSILETETLVLQSVRGEIFLCASRCCVELGSRDETNIWYLIVDWVQTILKSWQIRNSIVELSRSNPWSWTQWCSQWTVAHCTKYQVVQICLQFSKFLSSRRISIEKIATGRFCTVNLYLLSFTFD